MVNPQIPHKFKFEQDQVEGKMYEEYEVWIVKDQVVFIWSISIIFELMLPRVLSYKHAFEVYDCIQWYLNDHMKAQFRKLCVELKPMKIGNQSITKYVL